MEAPPFRPRRHVKLFFTFYQWPQIYGDLYSTVNPYSTFEKLLYARTVPVILYSTFEKLLYGITVAVVLYSSLPVGKKREPVGSLPPRLVY